MATLEESLRSLNLVHELLRSSESAEHLPAALRRRISSVLRDYPSTEAVTRAMEPIKPNVTHQLMCALDDARMLIEYIAVHFFDPLDRGMVVFALRSYPDLFDVMAAEVKSKSRRSMPAMQTRQADAVPCEQSGA